MSVSDAFNDLVFSNWSWAEIIGTNVGFFLFFILQSRFNRSVLAKQRKLNQRIVSGIELYMGVCCLIVLAMLLGVDAAATQQSFVVDFFLAVFTMPLLFLGFSIIFSTIRHYFINLFVDVLEEYEMRRNERR